MNIAPVYLFWEGELLLDSTIKQAWPHVIDYPAWQGYSCVQHVSGEAGREGEVVLLRKEEPGFEFPSYLARTLKLEPERRVVWKTWPEKPTEGSDFFGIVEFRLHEAQGKTRFCYNTIYEFLVPYQEEGELETFRQQQYRNFANLFAAILPKLQKLTQQGNR